MSITITIENNQKYCEDNNLVDTYMLDPIEDAWQIAVQGRREIKSYPFELRLANANFNSLWDNLAINWAHCGKVDPIAIDMHLFAIAGSAYYNELKAMVEEAIKRNELITWG